MTSTTMLLLALMTTAIFAFAADGQPITAHDAVNSVQLTADEETFHVCPPPVGSTLLRLEPPRKCPEERAAREWKEGIAVIFKENINTYKFKANVYYKNVIQTTTWSGISYVQITSKFTERTPVDFDEVVGKIDAEGKCSTKAFYLRNNVMVSAFDRDEDEKDVDLIQSKYSTGESKAWHTTNETYTAIGSPWVYRSGTSVNCIVEVMDAKSSYPYNFFGLANGAIVDASPFYGLSPAEAAREHMGYGPDRFRQINDYFPVNLTTMKKSTVPVRRNLLRLSDYTVGWDWHPKEKRVCSMTVWKEVDEMLSSVYPGGRIRLMSQQMSATFIANTTEFDPDRIRLGQCVREDAERIVSRIFSTKYNETHVRSGQTRFYLTVGGYLVAYQPILSKTLASMYIRELLNDNRTDVVLDLMSRQRAAAANSSAAPEASLSRLRRAAVDNSLTEDSIIKSTSSAQFASLQFVYDNIQRHVNEMFSRLAAAWCELQNRNAVLWQEGSKINPSSVASANLGRKVSARLLGDVIAVGSCLSVSSSLVTLQNSMRSTKSPNTCYSRPLVMFSYEPNGPKIEGQLGENNELLQTTDMLEPCTGNQRRYFLFGSMYAVFDRYSFVRMMDVADVQLLTTFVELNVTLLEDREILPLQVYTKEELQDVGVLDFTEVSRRNQMHDLKFYDIDKVIEVDTNHALLQGIADVFSGLGEAGKAVGKVIVGAAGAVVSTVTGIASFLSNPFGALAIGLLVIAAIVAAFVAYRYISRLKQNPMKTLYPITTKTLLDDDRSGGTHGKRKKSGGAADDEEGLMDEDEEDEEEEEISEEKLEKAREMVKYLALLSAAERQEKKIRKKKNGTTARLSRRLDDMRLRAFGRRMKGGSTNGRRGNDGNGNNGYSRLRDDDEEEDDDFDNDLTIYERNGRNRIIDEVAV